MSGENETYRSRWEACDDCECVTIIERDDERGVPDPDEWDGFGGCVVCGGSLRFGNADKKTVSNQYWSMGRKAVLARATRMIRDTPAEDWGGSVTLATAAEQGAYFAGANAAIEFALAALESLEPAAPAQPVPGDPS